jgi:nicotinamide-nucleotide amidase
MYLFTLISTYMPNFLAEIITIGDELLYGQTLDTNSQFISQHLTAAGFRVWQHTSIADKPEQILAILELATQRSQVVLLTGGLGPTKDDMTKKVIAQFFGVEMRRDPSVTAHLERLFSNRGRIMNELNHAQADVPSNCRVLQNDIGTAPCMWFETASGVLISMPGVPTETRFLVEKRVVPALRERFSPPPIFHKKIKTVGIPEALLAEQIADWENELPDHIKLAYLPQTGRVTLRLTATGKDLATMEADVLKEVEKVMPLIGAKVYGFDDDELEEAVSRLLNQRGLSLAIAESCTGGFISHLMTKNTGASSFFLGSIIAYSNLIKTRSLGVSPQTLQNHGAVSQEAVMEMAIGVRKALGADIGIAATGIAGPEGGTPDKPVGTVWIAYADENECVAKKLTLTSNRHLNINFTANILLDWLRTKLYVG